MKDTKSNVIQSLWIGNSLSKVEQLCIKSFLDNGHKFHLYIYDDVKNLPLGTTVCNADDIIPKEKIFTIKTGWGKGSYAGFADVFRLELLSKNGGWWVDMDVICLKKFDMQQDVIICSSYEGGYGNLANNCIMKFPKGHPVIKYCMEELNRTDLQNMNFGLAGPILIQKAVNKFRLNNAVVDYSYFNPIAWKYVGELVLGNMNIVGKLKEIIRPFLKPKTLPGRRIKKNSYSVHLWNEIWTNDGFDKNGSYPNNCLFEKLKRKHGI